MSVRIVLFLAVVCLGLVAFCSPTEGVVERVFRGHTGYVDWLASSPDGRTLASASNAERTIRLWNVATGKAQATIRGHAGGIRFLTFSPPGTMLAAAGGKDRTITVWDVRTGSEWATFRGHAGDVCAVAFSPDGRSLASGSDDTTVKVWDVATRTTRMTLQAQRGPVWAVAFSPDGKTLAAGGDKTVALWDVATGKQWATLAGHHWYVWRLAFSPDGQTLASADFITPVVKLWDVKTGQVRFFEDPDWLGQSSTDYVEYLVFSPDGKALALGTGEAFGLWEVASGKNTATFGRGHRPLVPPGRRACSNSECVRSVLFTRDGLLAALTSDNESVRMWPVAPVPGVQAGGAAAGLFGRYDAPGK